MKSLLISACLMGFECKYSGGSNALPCETLDALKKKYKLIPVCPEFAGGLGVPRDPSEQRDGGVYSLSGRDVTAQYRKGAEVALSLIKRFDCAAALLKERSPSCGSGEIYDGTFTDKLIYGYGVAAEAIRENGTELFGESKIEKLL